MNKIKFVFMFILSIIFSLLLMTISLLPVYASTSVLNTTNYYLNTDRHLSANEIGDYSSSIDEMEFTPGASLLKNDINTLLFEITLKDETLKTNNLCNVYQFMIGTAQADGTGVDYGIVIYLIIDNENNGVFGIGRKNVNYKENVSLYGYDYESNTLDTSTDAYEWYDSFTSSLKDDGWTFENEASFDNGSSYINYTGEDELNLYVQLETTSVYNYYFIMFINSLAMSFDESFFIISSLVSVHDVLTQMNTLSSFENELDSSMVEEAYYIVNDSSKRDVIVEYLVMLEDTPFAIKKQSKINVSVINNNIKASDVAKALGYKNMGVMQSYCGDFIYNSQKGIFTTTYQKSIWLSAKTVDGNNVNYFLDCNLSYYDYYYQFVEDGIFSNDLYEYTFNRMQLDYPILSSYKPHEIYGYFGFISIPNTYSVNALWEEMFGSNTTFDGILYKYKFTENLKFDSYNKLLNDYQYGWLEIAWNDVAGFVSGSTWSADYYLFYTDVETSEAFIAENGADNIEDNDSLIQNDVEDKIENLFGSETFSKIAMLVGLFLIIILLIQIGPGLTLIINAIVYVIKSILYVLTLPFRLIGKLFKRKKL